MSAGAGAAVYGWGCDRVCTRDELLARVEDFCGDGDLHVEVFFRELRSCTQVPPPFSPCLRCERWRCHASYAHGTSVRRTCRLQCIDLLQKRAVLNVSKKTFCGPRTLGHWFCSCTCPLQLIRAQNASKTAERK